MATKSGGSGQVPATQPNLREPKKQEESRGFFGKLGRSLNIGLNISAGAAKGTIESIKGEEDASGFIGGIQEGIQENQDWADVFEEVTGNRPEGKIQKGLVFGANLVVDPINFIPIAKVLKVGGKFLNTTKVGNALSKGITGSSTYNSFGKMFIPGFGLPKEFNVAMQGTRNGIRADANKIVSEAKDFWKNVPRGTIDEVTDILNTGKKSLDPMANSLANQLKKGLDNIYDELVERGLAQEANRIEFYFPRQFEKYLKADPTKWSNFGQFRPTKPGFLKQRKDVEGWIRNAPEVLTRYQLQANRVAHVDDLFKTTINKFGKAITDLVETGTDDLGRVIYRDNKTGEIYKSVAKSISKDKWAIKDEIADSFNNFVQGQQSGKFWRGYDRVQNFWKVTATSGFIVPNVGFNARNMIGNIWNNFLGGVMNPVVYGKAAMEQTLKGANYRKLEELGMLGRGQVFGDTEKILAKIPITQMSRFWDGVFQMPRKLSNVIENNARLANYIDQIGKGKPLDEALENVNKFLFDYTDLTDWERKWGRRVIPFYAWSRKNIPLQIEALITQPGKFAVPFKTKAAIEGDEGIAFENLPPWMQDDFGIKVPEFISNRLGDQGRPFIFNPYLPFQDLSVIGDPFGEAVERISPVVKMPIELAQNKKFFDGKPITEEEGLSSLQTTEDYWNYFSANLRIKRDFVKLTDEETRGFKSFLDVFGFKTYEINIPLSKRFKKQEAAREKSVKKKRRGQVLRGERKF